MKPYDKQKTSLEEQLGQLRTIPERTSGATAAGRAKFLAEAARLRMEPARKQRYSTHRAWQFAMAALMVLLVIFAGGAGAANAAQEAIPGEVLYSIKLLGEETRLALPMDPQDKIDLLMQYASARVSEMVQLREQNLAIPARTPERMENHIHWALVLAAGLDDQNMQTSLTQIRARLQEQVNRMIQVEGEMDGVMQETRLRLQERIQFMDESLGDLEQFRHQMRFAEEDLTSIPEDATDSSSPDPGKGPGGPGGDDGTPGMEKTPAGIPGAGWGPGPTGPLTDPSGTPGQ